MKMKTETRKRWKPNEQETWVTPVAWFEKHLENTIFIFFWVSPFIFGKHLQSWLWSQTKCKKHADQLLQNFNAVEFSDVNKNVSKQQNHPLQNPAFQASKSNLVVRFCQNRETTWFVWLVFQMLCSTYLYQGKACGNCKKTTWFLPSNTWVSWSNNFQNMLGGFFLHEN